MLTFVIAGGEVIEKTIKNFAKCFFDGKLELRIRLFNILAVAGVCISIATFILNIITSMYFSVIISALLGIYIQNRKVPDSISDNDCHNFYDFLPRTVFRVRRVQGRYALNVYFCGSFYRTYA